MVSKRYQVFISSTFADLHEERMSLWQRLTDMSYIVSGMENFPSSSDEPFEYIKPLIEGSDFFLLVIGTRYGTEHAKFGLSYTEIEFDHAVACEVPVLVFQMNEAEVKRRSVGDIDAAKALKLSDFAAKAANGRMIKFWSTAEELAAAAVQSVLFEEKRKPRPGWVRDSNRESVLELVRENQNLKAQIAVASARDAATESMTLDEMKTALSKEIEVSMRLESDTSIHTYSKVPLYRILRLEPVFESISYKSVSNSMRIIAQTNVEDRNSPFKKDNVHPLSYLDVDKALLTFRRLGVIDFDHTDAKEGIRRGRTSD